MALSFRSLSLPPPVLQGIEAAGFTTCTPIQERTLPLTLKGRDVAGQAQTGTGKTAAFLIVIFTRLLERTLSPGGRSSPRALVIAPTRELVVQIEKDARLLGQFTPFRILSVYGGVDYQKQREDLGRGVDILIGTPGRLIDYFKQKVYDLRHTEILVIDEADRMFDMGFIADLRFLLRRLPPYHKRQSMLFSATLSYRVMELSYEHMNDPVKIEINPEQVTVEEVEQALYHIELRQKFPLLLGLLRRESWERVLIFVNTRRQGDHLSEALRREGYHAAAITGDIPQKKRLKVLEQFRHKTVPILVATDVASRGLHIEGVSHVINYDLPQDSEDYVHRIGRTARAGARGQAISFADEAFVFSLEAIEEFIGNKIPVVWPEDDLFVKPTRAAAAGVHPGPHRRHDGRDRREHPAGGSPHRDGSASHRRQHGGRAQGPGNAGRHRPDARKG